MIKSVSVKGLAVIHTLSYPTARMLLGGLSHLVPAFPFHYRSSGVLSLRGLCSLRPPIDFFRAYWYMITVSHSRSCRECWYTRTSCMIAMSRARITSLVYTIDRHPGVTIRVWNISCEILHILHGQIQQPIKSRFWSGCLLNVPLDVHCECDFLARTYMLTPCRFDYKIKDTEPIRIIAYGIDDNYHRPLSICHLYVILPD